MESTGIVADKFYILLTSRDTKCNKLVIFNKVISGVALIFVNFDNPISEKM